MCGSSLKSNQLFAFVIKGANSKAATFSTCFCWNWVLWYTLQLCNIILKIIGWIHSDNYHKASCRVIPIGTENTELFNRGLNPTVIWSKVWKWSMVIKGCCSESANCSRCCWVYWLARCFLLVVTPLQDKKSGRIQHPSWKTERAKSDAVGGLLKGGLLTEKNHHLLPCAGVSLFVPTWLNNWSRCRRAPEMWGNAPQQETSFDLCSPMKEKLELTWLMTTYLYREQEDYLQGIS